MNKGALFERRAARLLRGEGLKIIERNFRCKTGEIDLVCREAQVLVFVEVRYRSHPGFGDAAASITGRKQRRVLRAAQTYLQQRGISADVPCRIDVVAFDAARSKGEDEIQWLRNAITFQSFQHEHL